MANALQSFDKRLRKIDKTHRSYAKGYTTQVGPDGLVVLRAAPSNGRLPIKGITLLMAGFIVFKALMFTHLGETTYNDRVTKLNDGTILEQAGGWVMQADQATVWIASKFSGLNR